MKTKLILFIAFVLGVSTVANAQNTFTKGDKVANLGVGIGTFIGSQNFKTTMLPISLSYEYGVVENIFDDNSSLGIGGLLGYYGAQTVFAAQTLGNYGYNYHYALMGLRANIHYQFVDRLDTYLGGMLGYNLQVASYYGAKELKTDASSTGGFGFAVYVGGRYYLLEKLAAFAEVGYGISPLTVGLSLKL